MSISLKNIRKTYGKQVILQDLSLDFPSNKIIGFLGPNGAGKSTTMKIIAGVLVPDQGEVFIENQRMSPSKISLKGKIGYLPENNPLYINMYVREILSFEADIQGIPNKKGRIEEVIQLTGLTEEAHKKVNQLSKGYKQRVGLALAILHDPAILLLDEPTSGLDPNQLIEIRALIKQLGKEKTVLLSTHIMQEVEALCDEIVIIHKGNIKQQFAQNELKTKFEQQNLEEIFRNSTS